MKRYEDMAFESYVANYYLSKIKSCKSRDIAFNLTLKQVHKLLSRKLCAYSKLPLTHSGAGQCRLNQNQRFSDVTIERIDNTKPYDVDNCLAVCYGFNNLKSTFENPQCAAGFKELKKFVATLTLLGL